MPDMNELLRWSIANSSAPTPDTQANTGAEASASSSSTQPLSLTFRPAAPGATASSHAAALHSSESIPIPDDASSPASTPGPATPADEAPAVPAKRSDLTTEMLDLILGKSDSITMKEKMAFALEESNSVDERVEALDDFEMLIELIDNANNMPILKLWQPLLSLLDSREDEIVAQACWIIGTAVQNNMKGQAAAQVNNTVPRLLPLLTSSSALVRGKATYALSSCLKHWSLAASLLSASSNAGYAALVSALSAPSQSVQVRRKLAFLINTLTVQDGQAYEGEIPGEVRDVMEAHAKEAQAGGEKGLVQGLKENGVYAALVKGLQGEGEGDVEFEENAMRALALAASKGGLGEEEKETVKGVWSRWGSKGQEEHGLVGQDATDIEARLA